MFTSDELEALVLGSRMVQAWGDAALASAVEQAVAKIEAVISPKLKHRLQNTPLFAVNAAPSNPELATILTRSRSAISARQKLNVSYRDGAGAPSERVIWPLGLFYWAPTWTLGAYCELRAAFRNFRLDRITLLDGAVSTFPIMHGRTVEDLIASYENEAARRTD
jgi:predicted DNA-binding transcriptional regulator YafY